MTAIWHPDQYLKFGEERLQPARDLLARIPAPAPQAVYDLGCGSGSGTRLLRGRWPTASITGIDGSPEMLARARAETADGGIAWRHADIADWQPPGPADVIYSNAALHWLDDHEALFPRLMACLARGGVLAVQMPVNFAAPTHTCITEAMRGGPWGKKLEGLFRPSPVAAAAHYFGLLAPAAARIDIWRTEYLHILMGADPVTEWTKGSVLKPLLDALDDDERETFLARYSACVARAYPMRSDGRTLLPFRRLFIVAIRA